MRKHSLTRAVLMLVIAFLANAPRGALADDPPTSSPTPIPPVTANKQWTPRFQSFSGVEMALVPPGCFTMGTSDAEAKQVVADWMQAGYDERDSLAFVAREQPTTRICFDQPFWIDKTEVTQAQFLSFNGVAGLKSTYFGNRRPVDTITWAEAQTFCEKRGARLPTEAEWEYAARGPDGLIYPWGNRFDTRLLIFNRILEKGSANVGSIPAGASWVGSLDMSGNMWEWTSSLYWAYPYAAQDGRENLLDIHSSHVQRGGSWSTTFAMDMRTAFREIYGGPEERFTNIGFRCAHSS